MSAFAVHTPQGALWDNDAQSGQRLTDQTLRGAARAALAQAAGAAAIERRCVSVSELCAVTNAVEPSERKFTLLPRARRELCQL